MPQPPRKKNSLSTVHPSLRFRPLGPLSPDAVRESIARDTGVVQEYEYKFPNTKDGRRQRVFYERTISSIEGVMRSAADEATTIQHECWWSVLREDELDALYRGERDRVRACPEIVKDATEVLQCCTGLHHYLGEEPSREPREAKDRLLAEVNALLDKVRDEGRDLTTDEQRKTNAKLERARELAAQVAHQQKVAAQAAAFFSFKMGMAYQRMLARPAEPHAQRGRKIVEAARLGHAETHGDEESKRRRCAEYQRAVDEIRAKNPRVSHSAACQRVASRFGVSVKTVKRHTRRK